MACVYGPVEVKMKHVLIDKASVECCYRPKSGVPGKKIVIDLFKLLYLIINMDYNL